MECIFLAIVLKHNCWTKLMFVMKTRFQVVSSHFHASRGRSLPFPVEWILTIYAQWMAQYSPHIMFSLKWKLDNPNQGKNTFVTPGLLFSPLPLFRFDRGNIRNRGVEWLLQGWKIWTDFKVTHPLLYCSHQMFLDHVIVVFFYWFHLFQIYLMAHKHTNYNCKCNCTLNDKIGRYH